MTTVIDLPYGDAVAGFNLGSLFEMKDSATLFKFDDFYDEWAY